MKQRIKAILAVITQKDYIVLTRGHLYASKSNNDCNETFDKLFDFASKINGVTTEECK